MTCFQECIKLLSPSYNCIYKCSVTITNINTPLKENSIAMKLAKPTLVKHSQICLQIVSHLETDVLINICDIFSSNTTLYLTKIQFSIIKDLLVELLGTWKT
jgi:hypothetical protein